MALRLYHTKRNFEQSSEPKGEVNKKSGSLKFVVQKHAASHLHYDFRLELEGVLKSWAVPKGPSLNPDLKRLAIMVEDHPYAYKDFEGNIPQGNYGAGSVIVWDHGTYHAAGGENGSSGDEKLLMAGLKKGHISFILEGKKLKGEFSLVKLKGKQKNAWLLIKKNDKYATTAEITERDKSVISNKRIEAIAGKNGTPAKINKPVKEFPGKKAAKIKPMLAQLADRPFDNRDWIFEIKYDGYRALALCDGRGSAELYSRNLQSFNYKYPSIARELEKISHPCLLDGEVVVEDEQGRSKFQLLQNYQKTHKGDLKYYVFDLLNLDGRDTTQLPLLQRKELLRLMLAKNKLKNIFYSDHIAEGGVEFYAAAVKKGLEGIMAKDDGSKYVVNQRTGNWLKIKITNEQEAVIAGITAPKGGRSNFGSILLGAYKDGRLHYIGHCGTGFDEKTLKELYQKFKPLFITDSPFKEKVKANNKVQWLKPKLVCQVKFSEWTADGSMRHPVYLGLRTDKAAKDVIREIPPGHKQKNEAMESKPVPAAARSHKRQEPGRKNNSVEPEHIEKEIKVGKVVLKLTNQQKIYWPDENITKGQLVSYYSNISSIILPYLTDRPQSLNRFPNGINKPGFFQKDINRDTSPGWLKTEKIYSESNKEDIDYLVCNDKATLIYMANLGCIEINPWNSRISHINNPDWLVIDLDPESISFKEVVKAALQTKKIFDEMEIDSYCKTSGATGLHVYVPLGAQYSYDIVKNFANLVAKKVNEIMPATTSLLRMPAKRKKKVYLDFLQNTKGQTLAAPYSVRPRPGAPVSTPLEWKEVNDKLDPSAFTMNNIFKRIDKKGDLWKPVLGKGANLKKALKNISPSA